MKCKKVEYLLPAYIMGNLEELVDDSHLIDQIEDHLRTCNKCTEEYKAYKQTIDFVEENKDIFARAFEELDRKEAEKAQIRKLKWARILAIDTTKPPIPQVLVRIAATAASITIAFAILFTVFNKNSRNEQKTEKIVSSVPFVKIENLSDNSIIPAGQEISTNSGPMVTLVINSKHRMILNENTSLSISPLEEGGNVGCLVSLNYGRIYTQVEHDGNPFIVNTANGKAIITGTTFDIEANEAKTTLVVAEGNVKFASDSGSVAVPAGYLSEIFNKSSPLQPSICDAKQLTAWASGYELKNTLAKIEAYTDSFDISDLWLTANSGPIDLEKIDYDEWIEKKRDWFKREFPKIFQLKKALAKEKVETDYPQLLFKSGDLWRFIYPEASRKQFSILKSDSILKVVSTYDFDEQWLLANFPSAKSLNNNLADMKDIFIGQVAFQEWIEQFKRARKSQNSIDSNLLVYSLHASTYLTNTRTLLWFYITNEQTNITLKNKAKLLSRLQNEVEETEKIKEYILRLFTISENYSCEEFNVLIDKIIDSLTELMETEEKVSKYEIGK